MNKATASVPEDMVAAASQTKAKDHIIPLRKKD